WDMRPALAKDAAEALAALGRAAAAGRPFPLIVLDALMPGVDGFALAARIKEDARFAAARMVMLSPLDGAGDAARCRALGLSAYLTKPVRQADLWGALLAAAREAGLGELLPRLAGGARPPAPAA